ncbi:MAG: hypothetical protein JNK74_13790 [Candidatus Hydrogenedentes bacterium]|nr:hypothetical protein [Candidatus Hydrogenedentota bacterium]
MDEHLARYIVDAPSERLLALTLEDIALAQAWYNSWLDEPGAIGPFAELPVRIAEWSADKVRLQRVTEGARQQPVLRLSIDALLTQGPDGLLRDELDFLFFVHGLILRAKVRSQFQRPLDQIGPHIEAIEKRRETLAPLRGLPNLSRRILIATEATIREAPHREIRSFGGLPEVFRGPVLVHGGGIKIVGDVPDGTAVVAERGTCYVSGYVLGRLLVSEHAEVQENIAGLLIAQHGSIRARGIVNRATVIAKLGRIACAVSQSPDLVYAGTQLRVRESAIQGTYFSPRIRVDQSVNGGCWHVTNLLKAEAFVHTEQRPVDIVLRTTIGYEDFGESLPKDAVTLLRAANRLQARIAYLDQLRDRQADEAEHYASTALLYICSGTGAPEDLLQVDSLKRRRAFLLRLMMGLHLLTKSLTGILRDRKTNGSEDPASRHSVQRAIQRSLAEVTKELGELKMEGSYPEELDREWEELVALHAQSSGAGADDALSRAILRFHESRKSWQEEVFQLEEKVSALQLRVAGDESRKALIQRTQAAGTSQPVLLQLARAARQRGPEDPVVKRMETPFVRRMLGLLKKRNEWVQRYREEAAEREAELAQAQKKLRESYHLDLTAQKPDPRAEGIFRGQVRIHVEELVLQSGAGAGGVLFTTGDNSEEAAAYGIRNGVVVRLPQR